MPDRLDGSLCGLWQRVGIFCARFVRKGCVLSSAMMSGKKTAFALNIRTGMRLKQETLQLVAWLKVERHEGAQPLAEP
jgi:hypothetical protein